MLIASIPARPGTYALLLAVTRRRRIIIGRLGALALQEGCYCYVGSALGPGGLRARLRHHLGTAHRLHWHIDYLRRVADPAEIWFCDDPRRTEHEWADSFRATPAAAIPLRRFGASDCTCDAHLFHFAAPPDFAAFERRFLATARSRRQLVRVTEPAAPMPVATK